MSKPKTIQDLKAAGVVSERDINHMAGRLFNNLCEMHGVIDGYVVWMPEFDQLPETCQQFIRKALGFSNVQNVLDIVEPDCEPYSEELEPSFDPEAHHEAFGPDGDPNEPL